MSLTITPVPDCNAPLGPAQFTKAFMLQPGVSDYPTGGYNISAAQLGIGNLFGAWSISKNPSATAYGIEYVLSTYPTTPQAQPNIFVQVTSAGSQVSSNTNLAACTWIAEFLAQGE